MDFIVRLFICVHVCLGAGLFLGYHMGNKDGYEDGQKEVAAYRTELETSKKETDRAVEMYTELLATCRGEQ